MRDNRKLLTFCRTKRVIPTTQTAFNGKTNLDKLLDLPE